MSHDAVLIFRGQKCLYIAIYVQRFYLKMYSIYMYKYVRFKYLKKKKKNQDVSKKSRRFPIMNTYN